MLIKITLSKKVRIFLYLFLSYPFYFWILSVVISKQHWKAVTLYTHKRVKTVTQMCVQLWDMVCATVWCCVCNRVMYCVQQCYVVHATVWSGWEVWWHVCNSVMWYVQQCDICTTVWCFVCVTIWCSVYNSVILCVEQCDVVCVTVWCGVCNSVMWCVKQCYVCTTVWFVYSHVMWYVQQCDVVGVTVWYGLCNSMICVTVSWGVYNSMMCVCACNTKEGAGVWGERGHNSYREGILKYTLLSLVVPTILTCFHHELFTTELQHCDIVKRMCVSGICLVSVEPYNGNGNKNNCITLCQPTESLKKAQTPRKA